MLRQAWFVILMSLALAACGGSDSSTDTGDGSESGTDGDTGDEDTAEEEAEPESEEAEDAEDIEELFAFNDELSDTLENIFQGETSAEEACDGGSVDVDTETEQDGSTTNFTMDVAFEECDGVDGGLTVDGSVDSESGDVSLTYNGTLTVTEEDETCSVTYTDFTATFEDEQITYNGSLSSTCEDGTISCEYDNLTIDADTSEEELAAALAEDCSVS